MTAYVECLGTRSGSIVSYRDDVEPGRMVILHAGPDHAGLHLLNDARFVAAYGADWACLLSSRAVCKAITIG